MNVESFLHDLVFELMEQTRKPLIAETGDFQRGYQFGLMVVLDLIKHRAESLGINLKEIGLDSFDPEQWFLGLPPHS